MLVVFLVHVRAGVREAGEGGNDVKLTNNSENGNGLQQGQT